MTHGGAVGIKVAVWLGYSTGHSEGDYGEGVRLGKKMEAGMEVGEARSIVFGCEEIVGKVGMRHGVLGMKKSE
ncbi:unnamed protein product [Sphenostylis stenocarpa]|uniref:Uncharacterized protein n=1 Tax=Sphenostylis stenocarpa TaxID=92480 RepID=A0AA86SLH8_9FABA|nr:unnamed protein product [Sphenostylis stenocarpa]